MDTDAYGHVNNVEYYSYFDTLITTWLVEQAGADPATDPAIGLCAESQCRAPVSFPATVAGGLRVRRVGRSSVRYEIALYTDRRREPVAIGYFSHVYVDRRHRKPVAIPEGLRRRLGSLRAAGDAPSTAA
jgi:acyl-CoA thioester hydrolase